jgi:ABC-type transport system involved in cytochrome c biogenesis permease subunit
MRILTAVQRIILLLLASLAASATSAAPGARAARVAPADDHERGDVPGWVMITLMSAVLVAALLAIAGPALEGLFNQAIDQVSP